jgi:hypothetical protein
MRSTQLATLLAIKAGADTSRKLAAALQVSTQGACQRLRDLMRDKWIELLTEGRAVGAFPASGATYSLTPKALSLLEARARLDGEPREYPVSECKIHFAQLGSGVLCHEPRWDAADTNKDNVTCRRCLYLLGRYMPTDPERREELTKRQNELTKP